MESSETQGIDLLFKKLGHEIVEIRTRALESILSKLKHGLVHDADIVQERQLLVRLLEWFNFNPSPKQDVVLELLTRLTKHAPACELLVSLGAVTFLSKLRTNIDGNLRSQVDVVIDRLLHVTEKDVVQASTGPRQCIYGDKKKLPEESNLKQEDLSNNYGYFTPSSILRSDDSSSTITPPIPLIAATEIGFHQNKHPGCLRFHGFSWHSLTGTDKHVLMSTGSSLCSPNPHSVRTACAFLLDVLFRDFPPEIFLQRPAIVQTLLTLIGSRPGGHLMTGALACLQALAEGLHSRLHFFQDPTFYCPRQGLPFHCNTLSRSRLSDLESFSESDLASRSEAEGARRFERSVGDGRDEPSSSTTASSNSMRTTPLSQTRHRYRRDLNSFTWESSQVNDDSENDLASLQRSTITAPQFCVSSLIAALPSLKTESSRLALNIFQATIPLIKLLYTSLRSDCLWCDNSALGQNLQAQVRQLLELVGDVLLYHYHLDDATGDTAASKWNAKSWSNRDAEMHRLIFQALASVLLQLVKATLPVEQAAKEAKSRLSLAFFVVACDLPLALASPEESELALSYLEQCSPEKHDVVCRARKIFASFQHTHMFLKDYRDVNESDVTLEIMEFAESSIEGLPYHSDTRHLKAVIRAVSKVFFNAPLPGRDSTPLQLLSKRVLLRLLAHPLVSIRRTTYDECLRLLRAGINVNAAAENLGHTASYIARFLLHPDVLYEVCCHGLGDSSRLVCHPALEIMTLLLQGRLLIADEVWNEFCSVIQPVLPVLQAYTAETDLLRSALNVFISPNEHPDQDWDMEFFKSCLRSLMLKNRSSRSNAAEKLSKMLEEKENLPHVTGLTDLLMVDTPLSLVPRDETDCFRIRRCVFQEDAVLRMLSVFRSTSTEDSIRVGALRQLATMLDDPGLHDAFLNDGGLESICEKFLDLVRNDVTVLTGDVKPSLASCIMIIKLLVRRDSVVRERMSRDLHIMTALLKAADLCRLSIASLNEISVVIALLVFHDVIKVYVRVKEDVKVPDAGKNEVTELSLPAATLTRYQIPFLCPSHHTVSIHRTLVSHPSPSCDPIFCAPPSFLRVAWNLATYDGDVVALCNDAHAKTKQETSSSDEFDLKLTEEDILLLGLSHPALLSSSLLDAILGSKSHSSASHAFAIMKIAIVSSRDGSSLVRTMLCGKLDEWKEVLGKFLRVAPTCYDDEVLLTNLTLLLDQILKQIEVGGVDWFDVTIKNFLLWFLDECLLASGRENPILGHGSPLLRVLEPSEPQPEPATSTNEAPVPSETVRRQLCKGVLSLLSRMARLLQSCDDHAVCSRFHRELRTVILLRLRLADAPQFYDVPSMEITLECLVHVSACRMKLRHDDSLHDEATDTALLQQLIGTLLEIVSAFHIRSGTSNMSYMGKGVSRCATQCILHLAREISVLEIADWPNLLQYAHPNQTANQPPNGQRLGLEWLVPLWSSRDPQMRFSGLAVSSIIARTKSGAINLANSFANHSGGIWSMTLCVALDHSECSAVRGQAFNLLCNLVTHKFDPSDSAWQGPMVQEEESGSTLTGLPALFALFHHAHVYEHISLILTCFHPHPTVRSAAQMTADLHDDGIPGTGISPIPVVSSTPDSTNATVASKMSALTQTSIPNQSPAFSVSNKDNLTSRNIAAGDAPVHRKTPSYPPSPINSLPDGWRSLTTPSLVTSVCRFLCNLMTLAPHDTIRSLLMSGTLHLINSVLDTKRIQSLFDKLLLASNKAGLKELVDSSKQLRRSIFLRHLLEMHGTVARLLTMIVSTEKSLVPRLLSPDESFVKRIVLFLSIETSDDSWTKSICEVRHSVLAFLCAILHQNMKEPLPPAVLREWRVICSRLLSILDDRFNSDLQIVALQTLALLFKSENIEKTNKKERREVNLTWLLEKSKGSSCDATDLTTSLVHVFESQIVNPSSGIPGSSNDKLVACCHALQNLFACSPAAQKSALEVGFLERILAEARDQHSRMSLQFTTLQANKARSSNDSKSSLSENYESYIQIINLLLSMLNNLLHAFIEGKEAAASSNLALMLSLLWSWSSHFSALLIPLLRLTVTYTAHCTKAASSITTSPSSSQPSVATALVRLCRDVHSMVMSRTKCPSLVLQLVFNALINSAAAPECRALLWKTNLLELFPAAADRGQHPKRSKQQALLLDCWLRLLLSLSFHTDGQLNLLKIRDFLDILLELHSSNRHQYPLLILHNLCFHGPSKNRLSSNGDFVHALMSGLCSDNEQVAKLSSTAILALLCNNQKAKVHLKSAGLVQNLQNALARLTLAVGKDLPSSDSPHKKSLNTMLEIMRS